MRHREDCGPRTDADLRTPKHRREGPSDPHPKHKAVRPNEGVASGPGYQPKHRRN